MSPLTTAVGTARERRHTASGTMKTLAALLATLTLAIVLGLGSAWYAIEHGTPITTAHVGPWSGWLHEGDPAADAYTKAHIARSRRLPLSAASGRVFIARTDSEGKPLTSACSYIVQGPPLNAQWWSIALYDATGKVMDNPSGRFSITGNEMVRRGDGHYRIFVGSEARPENWLPVVTNSAHDLMLVLRLYGPRTPDERSREDQGIESRLPSIEKQSCS
jgi:hypothetical protein